MIADAVYFAIAGFDFYHALARALVSRGVEAGRLSSGRARQLIDATARRRRYSRGGFTPPSGEVNSPLQEQPPLPFGFAKDLRPLLN